MLVLSYLINSGIESHQRQTSNTKLQQLVEGVPDLLNAGRASSTRSKYERAWQKWFEYCTDFADVTPLPADPFDIAVYFNYLLTYRGTRGSIVDAMYGIRWGHIVEGHLPPTDHPFVKLAYDGAIRLSNYEGTKKKDPFTSSMLHALVNPDLLDDLIYLRFVTICILGFTGFLRLDELLNLRVRDIQFYSSYMTLTIPKCKNDQIREGNVIHIAELDSKCCPVFLTAMYIQTLGLLPDDFLICKLAKTKKGHNAIGSHQMSSSYIRKSFKQLVQQHLPGSENVTPHSLRAGGASSAAENGTSDRLISKHGRWKSEGARNGYIKDSLKNRLSVSKNLGL